MKLSFHSGSFNFGNEDDYFNPWLFIASDIAINDVNNNSKILQNY